MDNKIPQYTHHAYSHRLLIYHALNTSKRKLFTSVLPSSSPTEIYLSESLPESAEEDAQDMEVENT